MVNEVKLNNLESILEQEKDRTNLQNLEFEKKMKNLQDIKESNDSSFYNNLPVREIDYVAKKKMNIFNSSVKKTKSSKKSTLKKLQRPQSAKKYFNNQD